MSTANLKSMRSGDRSQWRPRSIGVHSISTNTRNDIDYSAGPRALG